MNTPFETVYKYFMKKIEAYDVLGLTDEEINEDNLDKLMVAMGNFTTLKGVTLDLDYEEFSRELTQLEINILSLWMLTEWIKPRLLTEENLYNRLGSKDYKNYSPANMLDKLTALKQEVDNEAHYWTKKYSFIKISSHSTVRTFSFS